MKYFTLRELCKSATANKKDITNVPEGLGEVLNMVLLIEHVLDPAREWLGEEIFVNSGYRCKRLNKAVGGVNNSQHCEGRAADITAGDSATNFRLLRYFLAVGEFDQLIVYQDENRDIVFFHVSYVNSLENRKEIVYKKIKR